MRLPHRALARALSCALIALGASSCASSSSPPHAAGSPPSQAGEFMGAALAREPVHDFTLTAADGRVASTREYRGRVLVLAFLGTRCGAPCLVIAQQVRGALDQLARAVPVLIVSVEPASDSSAAIRRFLARVSLTGRARYLTGTRAALRAAWLPYHVPAPARGADFFERFAPVILLDREGRARVEYALEQLTPEALAHDIRALEGG